MRGARWFLLVLAAAACGRTELELAPDDDAAVLVTGGRGGGSTARGGTATNGSGGTETNGSGGTGTGGAATNGGSTARGGSQGSAGFVGFGGTATSGNAGSAGSNLTHAGNGGVTATAGANATGGVNTAGDANTAGDSNEPGGFGGEAGAALTPTCVVRVSPELGDDTNDGTSWARAVVTLTRALSLVQSGCEVWLTSGTYLPTTTTDRAATFFVPRNVTIRGGFDGTERRAADRTFATLLPLLSGNIGDESSSDDDVYHVLTTLDGVTLDHLYVTRGHAAVGDGGAAVVAEGALTLDTCNVFQCASDGDAAGILAHAALTVRNSTFTELEAQGDGGAITLDAIAIVPDSASALVVENTLFDQNSAADGSAIEVDSTLATSSVSITDSSFARNGASGAVVHTSTATSVARSSFDSNQGSAILVDDNATTDCSLNVDSSQFTNGAADSGAALAINSYCTVSVDGSLFENNTVTGNGGAIAESPEDFPESGALHIGTSSFQGNSAWAGGAIEHGFGESLELTSDSFTENTARMGGGVASGSERSLTVTDCNFLSNSSVDQGGVFDVASSSTTIVSSQLARNDSAYGSVIYELGASGLITLTNVTAAENINTTPGGSAFELPYGTITVENSILWDDTVSEFRLPHSSSLSSDPSQGGNLVASNLTGSYPNFTAFDPLFSATDVANGQYRLSPASPCIDTADDALAPALDLAGDPRVREAALCPTCTSIADMGAFEYDE